jgi:hypothetical protein
VIGGRYPIVEVGQQLARVDARLDWTNRRRDQLLEQSEVLRRTLAKLLRDGAQVAKRKIGLGRV